ncbi:putative SMAD/FHA domain-containing protein [Seiridium cardinale]|uniref:SMAD/FHA domain-containing protein n=1 Tax=Seiridium cardinale TaxID=138064 RepID=A0ABR2XQM3_9PEZI
MGSDDPPRPRRSRHDDHEDRDRGEGSKRSHRDDYGRDKKRDRSGSRDGEKRRHNRSRSPRSPDPRRRPSRSRERERHRDRDRRRERDEEPRRRRSPDDDQERRDRARPRRRHRDREEDDIKRGKEVVKRSGPLPSQADSFAIEKGEEPPKEKEKPNYGISGALAAASNSIAQADGSTIVLKYHEPPEARKPSPRDQWKLFVFKGQDIIDTIELNARTCWLIGREMTVIDIAAEHPSISKQHAVIQFRYLEKRNEFGDKIGKVKPYLIDLDSANGTMINSKKVPESRYLELKDKDLIQFGQSTREYVLMLAPKDG